MNKRALLVLSMVTLLGMCAIVSISAAQSSPVNMSSSPAILGAAGQPSAPPEELVGHRHHGLSLEAILKNLGITDVQKSQIRDLYVGFQNRTRKTRMELDSLKDEKNTMLLSGKVDQQKLAQIDDKIVNLVSDVMRERLKLRRDRLAFLTPEQIGRVADWQAEKEFRSKLKWMHDE